jgi:outer membrane lipoprotein-sorting protein
MMNKILSALFAVVLSVSVGSVAPVQAQSLTTQIDPQDLEEISAYLNDIRTLEGDFVQINPDGVISEGTFEIWRPGRLRFEYRRPNPTLVIADGFWVGVRDKQLKTTDRYPLRATPLYLLLKDNVNLARENAVQSVQRTPGQLRVTAVDPQEPDQGKITMVFAVSPLELRQWIVVDAQGLTTTIALRDVRKNVQLDAANFVIDDPESPNSGFGGD